MVERSCINSVRVGFCIQLTCEPIVTSHYTEGIQGKGLSGPKMDAIEKGNTSKGLLSQIGYLFGVYKPDQERPLSTTNLIDKV